jgi:Major Facilitator Superfamily
LFVVPETYAPAVLKSKAKYLRNTENDQSYKAPMEIDQKSMLYTIMNYCSRPFELLVFEPICFLLCLYTAFLLSILYLFFEAFPLVFRNHHDFELQYIGLTFIGLAIGTVGGMLISPPLVTRIRTWILQRYDEKQRAEMMQKPEIRLVPAMLGAILVPIAMFWFAFTGYRSVPWIIPILAGIPFGWGVCLIFSSVFQYLVHAYRQWSASAMAANTFMRCTMAGGFPLFAVPMYNRLGYDWASALLAFLCVLMAPLPFMFFYFGESLRKRSKFAKASA